MKRVNVRFEAQEGLRDIDVLFSASEEDEQLRTLMDRVEDPFARMWKVVDATGASVTMSEERIAYLITDNKRLRIESEDGTYWLKATMQIAEQKPQSQCLPAHLSLRDHQPAKGEAVRLL